MVDISRCNGENCDIKHNCYRYIAQQGLFLQSYIPACFENGKCKYFFDKNVWKESK